MTANVYPSLNGYDIGEVLYDGAKSLVYRGVRQCDQQPVVIKLLKRALPSHNELLSFRHQYILLKDLHIDGVMLPLALESWQEKLALVMPDNQSLDLKSYNNGNPLSIDEFLAIACQLAGILEQLHQKGITHKDIKPGNIVIQPESGKVALIDFSIASQITSENQSLQNPDTLSGTLSYLSPEQTGRMNRGVDYRTDFYSLGVTFYELLTGQLPFYSEDAMELVHSHLAREPQSLKHLRADIPPIINAMVQKLMAKNAEDRYQSGAGLLADLEQCQQAWQANHAIADFTLGQTDVAQRFHVSEKLYGRFNEVKTLLGAFDRVCDGHMEAVLISGLSGIGKTALVNEVHKPMTRSRGYFIKGKFDQLKRDTPFSALSQALRSLMTQLLAENDDQRQYWQTQLLRALGQQGQLLIELVPELEQLIGEQPAVEELQGAAASHRFHHLMQQFIQVFTTREHPLVLFLDDLQWIDPATLQLLTILLDCQPDPQWDRAHQSLLFIGAYRDNETPPEHSLHHTLGKLVQSGLPVHSLTLATLTHTDLNELVMDACHCSDGYAQPLSQVVYHKTRGNPFFVHQFLQQASDEGLFHYDFSSEHWHYELPAIRQLAISADVVDFMAARLHKLEPGVVHVLQLAACIGHQFDLLTLAQVAASGARLCAQYCWQAIQEHLLEPVGEDYKLVPDLDDDQAIASLKLHYRFAHDRVQQAAYSLISDELKARIHLDIGSLLKQQMEPEDPTDWLFIVVNHLNVGKVLISKPNERIELAQLNYQAAQTARRSIAYEAARQYSHTGLELLEPESRWQSHYSLTLGLHEEAIEGAFLLGYYKEQQQWSDALLSHSKNCLDSILTHQLHCLSLIAQDNPMAAVEYALPILQQLGIEFPEQPEAEDFQSELVKTRKLIGERDIASLIDLPLMTDASVLSGVRLLEKLNVALYIAKPALFPLAVFKQIQLAIRYGNTPEIIPFYGAYGFILSGVVNDIDKGYKFGSLALSLLDKLQAQAQKPLTFVNVYGPRFYKKPVKDSIKPLREASHAGLETGDQHYAAVSLLWANVYSFFAGIELPDLEQHITRDLKLMAGIHQEVSQVYTKMLHQVVLNLSGECHTPEQLQGSVYQINQSLPLHQQANDRFAICVAQFYQAILAYQFYDNENAINAINTAKDFQDAIIGSLYAPEFVFYDALIHLATYSEQTDKKIKKLSEYIKVHQETLAQLAYHAPMNFQHKWALIEAERCRISGDILAAQDHYDAAIEGAKQNQFIHEEALACELAARFYLQRNKTVIARAYITRAYYAWARWGAKAKTEHLEAQYPQLLDQLSKGESELGASVRTSSTHTETSVGMDLDSVMKCAHTLSRELNLSGLLNKLLNAVMENAGAQRTVLLLKDSVDTVSNHLSHWRIAAECRMDEQTRQIMHNVPLESYKAIPKTLLQQVIKTKGAIALDDARDAYQAFYNDPYFILDRKQQSVLCQPVLSKGKLMGLLYLENKMTTHVFHQSRQQLMQMMAAQAAISIENANLYEHLEEKVRDRTAQLKQAQGQLLRQARESGMAEIAIGVMHNIGNALTPLKTATDQTFQAVSQSDLVKQMPLFMKFLEKSLDSDSEPELEKARQITAQLPELVTREFERLAEHLQNASKQVYRIEEYVHLQSKYTQVKPMNESIDLNQLLKDIIKMLDDLLQQERIQLSLNLQPVPIIEAEKHQLVQILMNLVKNACEAMANLPIEQRKLIINNETLKQQGRTVVCLQIQDCGIGFESKESARLFAPNYQQKSLSSSIGLHESANYLIAQNATIEATSPGPNQGATFTILWPVSE